jgi:hypothetical protein
MYDLYTQFLQASPSLTPTFFHKRLQSLFGTLSYVKEEHKLICEIHDQILHTCMYQITMYLHVSNTTYLHVLASRGTQAVYVNPNLQEH